MPTILMNIKLSQHKMYVGDFVMILFIFKILVVLSFFSCVGFSGVAVSRGYFVVALSGLLIVVSSLVIEQGLWGAWASLVVPRLPPPRLWSTDSTVVVLGLSCSMAWDRPRSGIEPMSSAWAGEFSTCEPTGRPYVVFQ